MDPEVEPAPTAPPVLAAELGRSLVVLLCGALGVVPWLPALGVLEDPAALPWVCALGAAGSALAAALVGGWTARRAPDGVGGGVVAGAATAALSWTLGAAPVVAAWAVRPALQSAGVGGPPMLTWVVDATQRTLWALMLPGVLWVGLGGVCGALGAFGVPWRGWPRPGIVGYSSAMFLGVVVPFIAIAWDGAIVPLADAMANAWAAGDLAQEPLDAFALAGTVTFALQAAGAVAVMAAWARVHDPGSQKRALLAAPWFALTGLVSVGLVGGAVFPGVVVWLVVVTVGALLGLRAPLALDDRRSSVADVVQAAMLLGWVGGGVLQAGPAIACVVAMLPAGSADGDGAIAIPRTAVEVALAVRWMGGQWMWEIAKGAALWVVLAWTLPFWVRRR